MANDRCLREAETIRAAWGHTTLEETPDFAAHTADCETCREVWMLAQMLRDERNEACAKAHPPAAGAVWWRAERRAREEAARRAADPISLVHGIALGSAAAAVVAILSLSLGSVRAFVLEWWSAVSWPTAPASGAIALLSSLPLGALLALGASLVLAPVVIYLALEK